MWLGFVGRDCLLDEIAFDYEGEYISAVIQWQVLRMPYTSFISHNIAPDEQVIVYRLQTLASASGINVLLPQRNGNLITDETKHRIDLAESVIVFLTSRLTPHVQQELAYAEGRGKLIIPIYEKGARISKLKDKYQWIEYDPKRDTPGTVEQRVLQLLRDKKKMKEDSQAALLIVLGIGLLALLASKK